MEVGRPRLAGTPDKSNDIAFLNPLIDLFDKVFLIIRIEAGETVAVIYNDQIAIAWDFMATVNEITRGGGERWLPRDM